MHQPRRVFQWNRCVFTLLVTFFALSYLFYIATHSGLSWSMQGEKSASTSGLRYYSPKYTLDAPTVTVTISVPKPTTIAPLLVKEIPTASFRDNLRPELKYITAWPAHGWNNQVIEIMNLLYLSIITERVPILPTFSDYSNVHVPDTEHVHFGEVFDIPRLQKGIKKSVLEWRQVKDPKNDSWDSEGLGCWNLVDSGWPPQPHIPNLKLDVSYATLPSSMKSRPSDDADHWTTFWSLASLGFADTRPTDVTSTVGEHLLCFDNVFYVSARGGWEIEYSYSPAWRFIGRHMHWTSKIQDIANEYVCGALGIGPEESIPLYIAVHVRRGDFKELCKDKPQTDCLPTLSAYASKVEELKEEMISTKGITVEHVVMTSDEQDPAWQAAALELGWSKLDHSETVEKYGKWYPIFIDGVVLSGGAGFVGTTMSTASFLAAKRVVARGGIAKSVDWGNRLGHYSICTVLPSDLTHLYPEKNVELGKSFLQICNFTKTSKS
ncbi:hypothetical protein GGX14DRAFT_692243 [Mycena pura]|uniref:GDP-fucose protein O-fucosyltransferase 2 n=1 Tax=Mycena pura TaxID=153505 RepID=A0AAD6YVU2_9AGAR|nr:hypothetical protein GGX14DRAFT_692243 [Mycena pura]